MYLALYRKYRPTTFEDVLSQPHITKTLKNEVLNNKTAHAYLFTGPRGTGKTTCSKILAMAVNCQNPKEGNPCLACESCKSIETNSTLDVLEIDAASNNGVDNIRQLKEEASYTPAQCKYRVYIIDETHMLSPGAFNALLKIMEEPPPHVKFILATTEAHKVPATILSRCQRFDFHRIKPEDITQNLLKIAKTEKLSLDEDAADLIARLADGGMRDALSIMDRCIAFSKDITLENVAAAAGVAGREYLFELTDCLVLNDASKAIAIIDKLYSMSKDLQGLLEEFVNHLRNIMLTITVKEPKEVIIALPQELEQIKAYTKKLSLATILYSINELQECLDKMARSSDQRLTLELCMIKLCTPSMAFNEAGILSRLERLENMLKKGVQPVLANQIKDTIVKNKEETPIAYQEEQVEQTNEKQDKLNSIEKETTSNQPTQQDLQENTQSVATQNDGDNFVEFELWGEVLSELAIKSMPLCSVLNNSKAFIKGDFLYIGVTNAMASTLMKQEGNAAKVIDIVENKTGTRYKLKMKAKVSDKEKDEKKVSAPSSPFDDMIKRAKESGIEVNEE